jgi:hypothetical protein
VFDHTKQTRGLAGLALIALLAVACSTVTPASATPAATTNASSLAPTASAQPTTTVSRPSVTPAPPTSAPASPAPLPNGDYVSGVITSGMIAAGLNDPKVANDPQVTGFIAAFPYAKTRFTMHFTNGTWTQSTEADGQDQGVGDGGTYAFVDHQTMAIQGSSDSCVGTIGFSLHGEALKWTPLKESCGGAYLAVDRVVYGSTMWTWKP